MGRRPSPTALKILNGSAEHDPGRLNPNEPMPPVVSGQRCPAWLNGDRQRRTWRQLVHLLTAQRLLTVLDTMSLALLVDAFGDYLEARDLIASKGAYYECTTKAGETIVRRHPAVGDRTDAWSRCEHLLGKFGMNPSDRTRVKVAAEDNADPFEALLRQQHGSR